MCNQEYQSTLHSTAAPMQAAIVLTPPAQTPAQATQTWDKASSALMLL